MRHHAAQAHAAVVQRSRYCQQGGFVWFEAGTVAVAVNLKPHFEHLTMLATKSDDGGAGGLAVRDDFQLATLATQCQRLG